MFVFFCFFSTSNGLLNCFWLLYNRHVISNLYEHAFSYSTRVTLDEYNNTWRLSVKACNQR